MPPARTLEGARRRLALIVCLTALVVLAMPTFADAKRNVYVSDGVDGLVVYDVGANGALSSIQTPATGTSQPMGSVLTPDGRFLYNDAGCGCAPENLASFSVGANGFLTSLGASPQPTGGPGATAAAVTPDGRHLYVTNNGDNSVSAFTIGANGSLGPVDGGPVPTQYPTDSSPTGLAITPDGQHLYVVNSGAQSVSVFGIGGDGTLTSAGPDVPLPGASSPGSVKVTPDGGHLYVGDCGCTGNVYGFSIGAGGALTAVSHSPFDTNGTSATDLAITPGGNRIYAVGTGGGGDIAGFNIANDGELTAIAGSPFTAPANLAVGFYVTVGGAVAPDGGHLYVSNVEASGDGSAGPLTINPDGTLSAGTAVAIPNSFPFLFSVAITPNQPATASFTATPAEAGKPTTLDASGTSDPDGTVSKYAWNFGDGTSFNGTTPVHEHTYADPGTYMATLTTTDNEGCSTSQVYTGQSPLCNGSQVASTTRTVAVPAKPGPPPPGITEPSIGPNVFAVDPKGTPAKAKPAKAKPKRGTTIRYTLSENASVTFKAENQTKGRLVNGKCKRLTKKNRKKRACLRYKTAGFFAQNGVQGPNKLTWSGKVFKDPPNHPRGLSPDTLNAKKWLRPGTYRLTLQATNGAGLSSTVKRLSFKVVKR